MRRTIAAVLRVEWVRRRARVHREHMRVRYFRDAMLRCNNLFRRRDVPGWYVHRVRWSDAAVLRIDMQHGFVLRVGNLRGVRIDRTGVLSGQHMRHRCCVQQSSQSVRRVRRRGPTMLRGHM